MKKECGYWLNTNIRIWEGSEFFCSDEDLWLQIKIMLFFKVGFLGKECYYLKENTR